MKYSRWATKEEIKEKLVAINHDSEIKKSGIGLMYDDTNLYIKDDEAHSLIIGATGSGKTQTCLLPRLRLAIKAEESFILHDVKGEIYNLLIGQLKKQNYNTVVIDLSDPSLGNGFNPLSLPYQLYKKGEKDKAVDILEKIGTYVCMDESYNENADPFWANAAMSLFVGLALYLFENAKEEEINFCSIASISSNMDVIKEYVNSVGRESLIGMYLSSVVFAPPETRGSILSVFYQKIRLLTTRETLNKMMAATDFDITSIQKEKTAVFIINEGKKPSKILIPMIIDECYSAVTYENNRKRRLNIMIDEFEGLLAMKDFNDMLGLARGNNIVFSVFVKSLLELNNTYGSKNAEIIRMSFGNIIYLLANDIYTLEEVSKLCGLTGMDGKVEPLISIEELKLLDNFEAVVLIPRLYPIRTKILPDYQIDWKFDDTKHEIPKLKNETVNVYKIKATE